MGLIDVLEEAGVVDRTTLVPFGDSAYVAAPLSTSPSDPANAARGLSLQGITNMANGLSVAWGALSRAEGRG